MKTGCYSNEGKHRGMEQMGTEKFRDVCDLFTSGVISVNKTSRLLWPRPGGSSVEGKNKHK